MHVVHLLIRNVWRNAAPRLTPVSFNTLMIIIAPRRRWCECCFMKWVGRFRVPIKASRTDTTDGGLFSDTSECWVRSENDYNEMRWSSPTGSLLYRVCTALHLYVSPFTTPQGAFSPKDSTRLNSFVEMSRTVAAFTPKNPTQQNSSVELKRL